MLVRAALLGVLIAAPAFAGETPAPITIETGAAFTYEDADESSVADEEDFGITPDQLLWEGAREGNIEKVQAQLEAGANVDYVGPFGATPLLIGVREENREVIEVLVSKGANVDARTMRSWPLSLAIDNEDVATVSVLVEAGANLEAANEKGWTALMLAAHKGNLEMVNLFANNGAKINEESMGDDPINALLIAVDGGYTDIVQLLLENGASTEMKDGTPDAALEFAREQRESMVEIIEILESTD